MLNIRQSLGWVFSQQFFQFGMQLIGSVVIARLLTPSEVGIFSLAFAASGLLVALREFGVGSYLIREHQLTPKKIRTAFAFWLLTSWSLGALLFLLRNPVADYYQQPGVATVMVLLSVAFFITPFGQPANALLTREMHFKILHNISLISGVVGLVTTISLAYLGFSYMALAWGFLATVALRSFLLLINQPGHLALIPSFAHWREVLHFGGFMTVISLLSAVKDQGNKFIIAGILTPGSLALFERAEQLPNQARQGIMGPLSQVLMPAYAKAVRQSENTENAFRKVICYSTALLWPPFLTLALLSQSTIIVVFGQNWQVAGTILPYLLLSQAIWLTMQSAFQLIVAHGKVKTLATLEIGITALSIILAVISLPFGLESFAISRILVSIVNAFAFAWLIRSSADIRITYIFGDLPKNILVTLIAATPAILYRLFYGDSATFTALLSVAVLSCMAWLLAIYVTHHPLTGELGKWTGNQFRKSHTH